MIKAQCPHCRSIDFRRVGARNGVERAMLWLLQPYRCSLCGRHFYLFRWLSPASEGQWPDNLIEMPPPAKR